MRLPSQSWKYAANPISPTACLADTVVPPSD